MSNSKPVFEIRVTRGIKCAIWRNESSNGDGPMYNVTLSRTYRLPPDQRGANDNGWRQTNSLGRDDLLGAAHALQWTFAWICRQSRVDMAADGNVVEADGTVPEGVPF